MLIVCLQLFTSFSTVCHIYKVVIILREFAINSTVNPIVYPSPVVCQGRVVSVSLNGFRLGRNVSAGHKELASSV